MFTEIENGIYDQLAAGTALIAALGGSAIYTTQVPPTVSGTAVDLPYVWVTFQGGGYDNDTQLDSIDVTYNVRVVADDETEGNTIAGYIRDQLHDANLTLTTWSAYHCQHLSGYKMVETIDRVQYYHVGGLYRIRASL